MTPTIAIDRGPMEGSRADPADDAGERPTCSSRSTNELQPTVRAKSVSRQISHANSDRQTVNASPAAAQATLNATAPTRVEPRIPPRQPSASCAENPPSARSATAKLQNAGVRCVSLSND